MQAVIQTGGKQYTVSKGDKLLVEKLEGEAGGKITFGEVLLITGELVKIGAPLVSGAKVLATIVGQTKSKKTVIYKYKRRKGYHKRQGHRQQLTQVEINDIQA